MPTIAEWPATLPPAALINGSSYAPVSNAMPIPVEAGEMLTRRRFTGEMASMPVAMVMSMEQYRTLLHFYRVVIKEALPFMFYDPVKGAPVPCVFTGEAPSFAGLAPDLGRVSFTLMTKPVADAAL